MRRLILAILISASVLLQLPFESASAFGDEDRGGFALELEMPGHSNPPRTATDSCSGPEYEGYRKHVSEFAGGIRDENMRTGQEIPSGEVVINYPGQVNRFDLETEFTIEWRRWRTGCANDTDEFDIRDEVLAWVRVPTHSSVVPGLLAELRGSLPAPTVIWPDRSIEYDWLYVNVPMDFRITPAETVRREVTISNVLGTVSAWAQAEPDVVVMNPGEPDAAPIPCSYDDAVAPYRISTPGRCSHVYSYSSAVAPTNEFTVSVSILWDVTSSAPLAVNDGISSFTENIAVAEVQAIETSR